MFLAISAFTFSMLGAFLVRSGVLTSVHAFAVDPKRGVILLGILAIAAGSAFTLFAWRAPALKGEGGLFAPVSREGASGAEQPVPRRRDADGDAGHALSV